MSQARRQGGASAIELAIALPVVLLLALGALQWALVFHARQAIEHAVIEAARAGSVGQARTDAIVTGLARGLLPYWSSLPEIRSAGADRQAAVAAAGPLNPRELADLTPTGDVLAPFVDATRGGVFFIGEGAGANLPAMRRTRADADQSGRGWMGWRRNEAFAARSEERDPLAPALLAVALALGALTIAWAREGR